MLNLYQLLEIPLNIGAKVSDKKIKFEFEKETKNSVRYKEVPDEGQPPIVGSLYVQKWYAGSSKTLEITLTKKD
jgi:hypothetical protein